MLLSLGLVAFLAIGLSTARAQLRASVYSVTDLGVVWGMTESEPAAINNMGQIVGTSSTDTEGCAFRYNINTMVDIGGYGTRAFGISQTGLVVGDFIRTEPASPNRAALFERGGPIDIGLLPGMLYSRANAVNSNKYVVGYSGSELDSVKSRAFYWHNSTGMVDVGTLGGAHAQALAINDAGWVTGNAQIAGRSGASHAFLYSVWPGNGPIRPMQDLGTLGGPTSYGTAINMSNHVVGYSALGGPSYGTHAFLYKGGKMIDLGSLNPGVISSDYSAALGVNNSDQIVGYSYVGVDAVRQAAVIYYSPQVGMVNLNDLIGREAKTFWLYSATAVNDSGQIVACANDSYGVEHALLLNPIAVLPTR